jgi:hypothetical protein
MVARRVFDAVPSQAGKTSDMADERFDEAGTLVAPQMAADMQDELLTAATELDRLQHLLADAVVQLHERFAHAMDGQSRVPPSPQRDAVQAELGAALVALQFEDLASQLISHARRRLGSVADCLGNLVMADEDPGCDVQWVERPCPVAQHAVDAGSVELF